ncbi:MAG: prephenate dehydrogenase/arogenate dehydrogenase family protein [Planctomycetota bacterium]|nr:MAG: prephenate dehydrogenase/arogenate dehydrogenase family protein [Planctomycetota bacterium]
MAAMTTTLAFLGYGRFGRALGGRFLEVGVAVRALDPRVVVPDEIAAGSVAQLLRGATHVIVAVPIAKTEAALRELAPHLGANQLVMDVGSVKAGPFALMERVLGQRVPWLATHPLFGPTSLALGEQPMRVIACPNAMHPQAVADARALYARIGCELVEQDPERHDQTMASGHALAYFVAKGILESELTLDHPLAPPSVQALARTVRSVREDAGHLFASLHRENSYAAEARRKLLDALIATDEALRAPTPADEVAHEEPTSLRIAELDEPGQLRAARDVIDEIDAELVALLARRAAVSLRAARAKAGVGRGIRDPEREQRLLQAWRANATELGLDEDAVAEVFEAVLRFSRRHQRDSAPGPTEGEAS